MRLPVVSALPLLANAAPTMDSGVAGTVIFRLAGEFGRVPDLSVVDIGVCGPCRGFDQVNAVSTRRGFLPVVTAGLSTSSADESLLSSSSSDSLTGEGGAVNRFSRDFDCIG